MNFPENLKYTQEHEWVRQEGEFAYVGVTDFAQRELGDIVYIDVPTVGDNIEKDEVFGTIEAVKTVSDLFLPVGGEILEVNSKLDASPELVNSDPYGEGWIVKIKISNPEELNEILSTTQYKALIGQ